MFLEKEFEEQDEMSDSNNLDNQMFLRVVFSFYMIVCFLFHWLGIVKIAHHQKL